MYRLSIVALVGFGCSPQSARVDNAFAGVIADAVVATDDALMLDATPDTLLAPPDAPPDTLLAPPDAPSDAPTEPLDAAPDAGLSDDGGVGDAGPDDAAVTDARSGGFDAHRGDDPSARQTSFYACAQCGSGTSGIAGGLPIVFAVAVMLRRRRVLR